MRNVDEAASVYHVISSEMMHTRARRESLVSRPTRVRLFLRLPLPRPAEVVLFAINNRRSMTRSIFTIRDALKNPKSINDGNFASSNVRDFFSQKYSRAHHFINPPMISPPTRPAVGPSTGITDGGSRPRFRYSARTNEPDTAACWVVFQDNLPGLNVEVASQRYTDARVRQVG